MCNTEKLRLNILFFASFFFNSFLAYGVGHQGRPRVLYIVTAANGAQWWRNMLSPVFLTAPIINETYGHKSNLIVFWIACDCADIQEKRWAAPEGHINIWCLEMVEGSCETGSKWLYVPFDSFHCALAATRARPRQPAAALRAGAADLPGRILNTLPT